ncbi:MAG: hypothetical protein AB1589_07755, partial [Cyanobacteriota bacterium]
SGLKSLSHQCLVLYPSGTLREQRAFFISQGFKSLAVNATGARAQPEFLFSNFSFFGKTLSNRW